MNNLQVIEQREVLGKEFRIFGTFENPLFLAKDVAIWIEHNDVTTMLRMVDDNEKIKISTPHTMSGGLQPNTEYNFLTEDGFYEVLMQSRKLIAKQFKKQVKEILKSVRKNGMYAKDELLDNPDLLLEVVSKLKNERDLRLLAEKERDNAIRTKSQISDKMTATALNKASQLTKKVNLLEDKLGEGKRYATVLAVQRKYDGISISWKPLKDFCKKNGLEIKKVPEARYGDVNSYPAQAWLNVYGIKL